MDFSYAWLPGLFISRPNRFIAYFMTAEGEVRAHVPNTGRLRELLVPGAEVLLSRHSEAHRKTGFELRLIKNDQIWVSIDSQLPNRVVEEGFQSGIIDDFGAVSDYRREVTFGNSRFDFCLYGDVDCWVEVKGVTLVEDGWSYFPDAPTERGTRHLTELTEAARQGISAGVVFLVQHPAAKGFTPNGKMDPAFARAVNAASAAGVRLVAWKCAVSPAGVALTHRIPITLWEETNENPLHPQTRKSGKTRLRK